MIECLVGYFGIMCKDWCSLNCCNCLICDYVIGWCEDGCIDGWMGEKCIGGKKLIERKRVGELYIDFVYLVMY